MADPARRMIRDRGVKVSPHEAKDRHDARPLLLAQAVPAPRSLLLILSAALVAAVGLIVALVVAPDTAAAPVRSVRTVTVAPPTICERALHAKLATLEYALAEALAGHRYQARGVAFGQALVLPGRCGA